VAGTGALGEVEFLNRQTLEYFGKTTEELKNWALIDAVHPDDLPRVIEARKKSIEAGQIYEVEHRCRRADGVYRWFQVRGLPVRDAENKVTAWYLLLTDIDDRKKADYLLAAEKHALEMIADGASLSDILNHVCTSMDLLVAPSMTTILLMDPDGKRLWHIAGPRVPREWVPIISPLPVALEAGLCGTAAFLKERIVVPDVATDPNWPDRLRPIAIRNGIRAGWSEPIVAKDRQVLGTFALYSPESRVPTDADLALIEGAGRIALIAIERQRSQEALRTALEEIRESERELRQIVDTIPGFVCTLSAAGEIEHLNRQTLEYFGKTAEELKNWTTGDAVHADDLPRVIEAWGHAVRTGEPYVMEFRQRRADGAYRWFQSRALPARDQEGRVNRWYMLLTDIDDRKKAEEARKLAEEALKDQLYKENLALRDEVERTSMFDEIVGTSNPLKAVLSRIARVAPTDSTVLITGETGTGKELIARAIHKKSQRSGRAFVSVNCAAIPRDLIPSELFGHEKGAFTGATQRRLGRFELADGGTIFLDEVGELLPDTQVALLRVLQERELERVGGGQPIHVDVRVIAATNRDLEAAVANGTFRQDLFYRLNVFPIEMPPLRERKDDVLLLVEYFVQRYGVKAGKRIRSIDKKTLDLLQSYDWPGNIRELQNVVERSVILSLGDVFSVDELWLSRKSVSPAPPVKESSPGKSQVAKGQVEALSEREIIEAALAATRGRVSGPSGAAAKLGIPASTLEARIRVLKINKLQFKFH
jgi:formate hydrogenlyase transcriptional activator